MASWLSLLMAFAEGRQNSITSLRSHSMLSFVLFSFYETGLTTTVKAA